MKYKSKCRFSMLITVESEVKQIRPGEIIETDEPINSPYLQRIDKPLVKKIAKTKKTAVKEDASSA